MDERTAESLNVLLRGELSAVECYQRVLRRLPSELPGREGIQESLESHDGRAAQLALEIDRRGKEPISRLGLWGRLLGLFAAMLAAVGCKAAIRLLETIEHRGIARYDRSWTFLDDSARTLLTTCLFPQQVLSHQSVVLLTQS